MTRIVARLDGQEEVEAIFGKLSLSDDGSWWLPDFCAVRDLQLGIGDENPGSLIIELAMTNEARTHCVQFRFTGAREFFLGDFGMSITGFEIQDISDRQWEGIRWKIGDFEGGAIRFLARTASVRVETVS